MRTLILLIPVSDSLSEPRRTAEQTENQLFRTNDIRATLQNEWGLSDSDMNTVKIMELTDFMDRFNDEELNPDHYFMGYIRVENI